LGIFEQRWIARQDGLEFRERVGVEIAAGQGRAGLQHAGQQRVQTRVGFRRQLAARDHVPYRRLQFARDRMHLGDIQRAMRPVRKRFGRRPHSSHALAQRGIGRPADFGHGRGGLHGGRVVGFVHRGLCRRSVGDP